MTVLPKLFVGYPLKEENKEVYGASDLDVHASNENFQWLDDLRANARNAYDAVSMQYAECIDA